MPTRLAQHLVARGLLRAQTIEDAQRRRASFGGTLDTALLEMGAIAEPGMLQALSDVSGIRPVNLADFEPNSEMSRYIPANVAERLGAVPLSVEDVSSGKSALHVACTYPVAVRELEEVALLLGKKLELWVAIEARVRDWIAAVYGTPLAPRYGVLLHALDPSRAPPAPIPLTSAAAAQPSASKTSRPPPQAESARDRERVINVEEPTLEDALTREMVEQIARAVAEEPILLQVRKKPAPTAPAPQPPPPSPAPAPGREEAAPTPVGELDDRTREIDTRELARRLRETREETRAVDLEPFARAEFQETKTFDLSQLAKESAPPTWERDKTVTIDLNASKELARASATRTEEIPAVNFDSVAKGESVAPRVPPTTSRDDDDEVTAPGVPAPSLLERGTPEGRRPTAPEVPSTPPAPAADAAPAEPESSDSGGWVVPEPSHTLPPAPVAVPPPAETDEVRPPTHREFPAVVVFSGGDAQAPTQAGDGGMGLAPGYAETPASAPAPVTAPQPITAIAGVEWTLQDARAALKEASQDRDRIMQVALTFARRTFDFVAAFAIVRGTAMGWAADGEGAETFRANPPSIPLDTASVFRTVAMTRGSYVGPVPGDQLTAHYLSLLGRAPRTIFFYPVEVKDRLVCLLYGDPGAKPVSQRRLSDLLLFCQDLPGAFQELIVFRKQRFGASPRAALSLEEVVPQAPATAALGLGWSPAARGGDSSVRRSGMVPAMVEDTSVKPPSDFGPLLRKLTGPDAAARSAAMAELARTPDASAKVLVENFPGPTAWTRLPVNELPDADELGPIPAALSRLGRAGATALAPLLDADDPDVRYFALLTAGNMPHAELVGGVLRGLFDYEPDISSAARAAASQLRRLPRFVASMRDLRQELAAVDTLRRSLAARALGVLHDRESIEGLINLTGSDDELCGQAAVEALREITKTNIGPDQRRWTAWWAENRSKSRVEWLVAALRHPDVEIRLAAIEELSKAMGDNLGYFADAPVRDRDGAIRKWEAAAQSHPKLKKLD